MLASFSEGSSAITQASLLEPRHAYQETGSNVCSTLPAFTSPSQRIRRRISPQLDLRTTMAFDHAAKRRLLVCTAYRLFQKEQSL